MVRKVFESNNGTELEIKWDTTGIYFDFTNHANETSFGYELPVEDITFFIEELQFLKECIEINNKKELNDTNK